MMLFVIVVTGGRSLFLQSTEKKKNNNKKPYKMNVAVLVWKAEKPDATSGFVK